MNQVINIPNALTFLRILLIPVILWMLYFPPKSQYSWISVIAFWVACATDYFDGLLARAWSQKTKLGTFLDPVADKMLVASTLLFLAGFGRLSTSSIIPASVILCREILVSGLREFLSDLKVKIPVSNISKWKTTLQMGSISFLLLGNTQFFGANIIFVGEIFLWCAAVLTIFTGAQYIKAAYNNF